MDINICPTARTTVSRVEECRPEQFRALPSEGRLLVYGQLGMGVGACWLVDCGVYGWKDTPAVIRAFEAWCFKDPLLL